MFSNGVEVDGSGYGSELTVKDLLGRMPHGDVASGSGGGDVDGRTWRIERRGASPMGRDLLSTMERHGAYVPV